MPRVMEDIIKHMDGSALKGVFYLEVMLRCSNDNKSNMSKSNDMGRSMGPLPI